MVLINGQFNKNIAKRMVIDIARERVKRIYVIEIY